MISTLTQSRHFPRSSRNRWKKIFIKTRLRGVKNSFRKVVGADSSIVEFNDAYLLSVHSDLLFEKWRSEARGSIMCQRWVKSRSATRSQRVIVSPKSREAGGFSPMKILSGGGNWQTGLEPFFFSFCDCPDLSPLKKIIPQKIPMG